MKKHGFEKPVDQRGVNLMVDCARALCEKYRDVSIAFGQSDEFSFVLGKKSSLWKRREAKLLSAFASCFTSNFVFLWSKHFGDEPLLEPPVFDSRCIVFPSDENMRDYLSWRQADTHINHLLNCCFWALVEKQGKEPKEAQRLINGTSSAQKHEILFAVGLNYNNEPAQYRKGTVLYWSKVMVGEDGQKRKSQLMVESVDLIQDAFWNERPHLVSQ